jgi:pyrimidine operon attenuation protein/uracil phosphoribosyltransferase
MGPTEVLVLDAAGVEAVLDDLADRVAVEHREGAPLALIGIRTRGVPIASRLAQKLTRLLGQPVPVGALDITLYRDDLGDGNRWPVLLGTEIPFSVDGAEIVLVDDVLYTGRTIRAALDALMDYGRPRAVKLAVLVDRGHRELPIQPDFVGLTVQTSRDESVKVTLSELGGPDRVVLKERRR